MGLLDRLKALTTSKSVVVRKSVAFYLLRWEGPAVRIGIVATLLDDAVPEVRAQAGLGLLGAAMSGRGEAPLACAPLTQALAGPHGSDVVWPAADSTRCPGLQEKALSFVEAKVANPETVTNAAGINFDLAITDMCKNTDAAFKKRVYDAAARLVSTADPDRDTRVSAIPILAKCDPDRARAKLAVLTKDKDSSVADEAKKALTQLH